MDDGAQRISDFLEEWWQTDGRKLLSGKTEQLPAAAADGEESSDSEPEMEELQKLEEETEQERVQRGMESVTREAKLRMDLEAIQAHAHEPTDEPGETEMKPLTRRCQLSDRIAAPGLCHRS